MREARKGSKKQKVFNHKDIKSQGKKFLVSLCLGGLIQKISARWDWP
jgi:hypothetical protein